ncbi:hypothetical protein [[Mycoplasma] collis]|uniref:hypothetical protein n=1 Tax=[Mycoplasma] collis TaxID=2127 RepID=UPI00051BA0EB|nr:hypothetical protein [[Mycoplasma] collis]
MNKLLKIKKFKSKSEKNNFPTLDEKIEKIKSLLKENENFELGDLIINKEWGNFLEKLSTSFYLNKFKKADEYSKKFYKKSSKKLKILINKIKNIYKKNTNYDYWKLNSDISKTKEIIKNLNNLLTKIAKDLNELKILDLKIDDYFIKKWLKNKKNNLFFGKQWLENKNVDNKEKNGD